MTDPAVGQTWERGRETRLITRIDGYIQADCRGQKMRDRVVCTPQQWAKWSASAKLIESKSTLAGGLWGES